MSLTVSQWIQVVGIIISASISIAKWVWDARREKRSIQGIQQNSEATERAARGDTPVINKIAFFVPLVILVWQTYKQGDLERVDFGIMLSASVVFIAYMVQGLHRSCAICVAASIDNLRMMNKVVDLTGLALATQDKQTRSERVGGGQVAARPMSDAAHDSLPPA
jgi:hypothetical protein